MVSTPITTRKINELPEAAALSITDVVAVMQGNTTAQITVPNLAANIPSLSAITYFGGL